MNFRLSDHAEAELIRRKIPRHLLEELLERPQQVVDAHGGRKVYQSQVDFGNAAYLLRAVLEDWHLTPTVVTVYRTSKIVKYWRVT